MTYSTIKKKKTNEIIRSIRSKSKTLYLVNKHTKQTLYFTKHTNWYNKQAALHLCARYCFNDQKHTEKKDEEHKWF